MTKWNDLTSAGAEYQVIYDYNRLRDNLSFSDTDELLEIREMLDTEHLCRIEGVAEVLELLNDFLARRGFDECDGDDRFEMMKKILANSKGE